VFGYPGGAVLPLYDALALDKRVHHILVRHEQATVHAAQGYARSTGRLGVVFVTSGPGIANTTSGLLDALQGNLPAILKRLRGRLVLDLKAQRPGRKFDRVVKAVAQRYPEKRLTKKP
jgi:glyoxylate carboligase